MARAARCANECRIGSTTLDRRNQRQRIALFEPFVKLGEAFVSCDAYAGERPFQCWPLLRQVEHEILDGLDVIGQCQLLCGSAGELADGGKVKYGDAFHEGRRRSIVLAASEVWY